ncbi:LOW QUALITY PROTEIN: hypothetical protein OSB04_023884, partial [Centaurea solstitialis]
MYSNYAKQSSFDIRLSSKKSEQCWCCATKIHFMHGAPKDKCFNSLDRSAGKREFRNSNVKRCDCKAGICLRLLKGIGKYERYSFIEHHNYPLLSSYYMQLGFGDQMLIHRGISSNMGATKVHKMRTSLKVFFEFICPFQNFKRDMDKYIVKGGDALMFIEMMNSRKEDEPKKVFDYKVSNSKLVCIFWADETSRFNYTEFGDVMSFDATFGLIDCCRWCCLVNKETIANFKWVLEEFLKAHKKQPTLVLIDQCVSMKQPIASVFPNSRHRLCMWHIMNELLPKFKIFKRKNFRKKLNKIVWDVLIEPDEFELKWNTLMEDYCLTGEKWLKSLYPNVLFDEKLKTTSRSESINSFFNAFSHYGNTLVFFMKSFDAALDKQRFTQRKLDHVTRSTIPKFLTLCKIERHASNVYTRRVFNDVEKEIYKAAWSCSIESVVDENDIETYTIVQRNKALLVKSNYKVVQDKGESTIVLINSDIEEIAKDYIMWRRDLMSTELQHSRVRYGDVDEDQERLFNEILSMVDHCLGRLRSNNVKLSSFAEKVRSLKIEVDDSCPIEYGANTKIDAIVDLIGVSQLETIEVHPPTRVKDWLVSLKRQFLNLQGSKECVKAVDSLPIITCETAILNGDGWYQWYQLPPQRHIDFSPSYQHLRAST